MNPLAFFKKHKVLIISVGAILFALVGAILTVVIASNYATTPHDDSKRLITVYDRGVHTVFMSDAKTLGEALEDNDIPVDPMDSIEPSLDEELVAPEYQVNVYRARPVMVIDGQTRIKVVTPYQTADRIARDAGMSLHPEDGTVLSRSSDYTGDGAGLQLTIKRSIPIILDLYGRKNEIRTQGATIQELLDEKGILLGEHGRVSLALNTPITSGLEVRVWREGAQTITIDEPIPFDVEYIQDADRLIGYKEVSVTGKTGVRSINYAIEIKDGVEIARKEIARIDTQAPTKQVEIIGIKSHPNALTKAKGAQYFTDSNGVSHRETYYDLNMSVVMNSCGQGGKYSVRFDGAKVDADGYIIVAANYGNYPKCSVVETSMGPGKVYDTGGFAARHPHGFDLATDWSRADGI